MSDSMEVQVARIAEGMRIIVKDLDDAAINRNSQYKRVEEIALSVALMDARVKNMESTIASNAPTLAEFIAMKHKVQGAGIFGRWIWVAAGALIGLLINIKGLLPWIAK